MVIIVKHYLPEFAYPPTTHNVGKDLMTSSIFLMRNQEIKDIEALAQGLMGGYVAEPSASHTAVCPLRGHIAWGLSDSTGTATTHALEVGSGPVGDFSWSR